MIIEDFLEDFDFFMENDNVSLMDYALRTQLFCSYIDIKKETAKAEWFKERFEELGPKVAELVETGDLPAFIDSFFEQKIAEHFDEEEEEDEEEEVETLDDEFVTTETDNEFISRIKAAVVEGADEEPGPDDAWCSGCGDTFPAVLDSCPICDGAETEVVINDLFDDDVRDDSVSEVHIDFDAMDDDDGTPPWL